MEQNELVEIESENGVISVNTNEITNIVEGKIDYISQLEKEVENSESSAKDAMNFVGTQMQRYEDKGFLCFHWRSGNNKDIIEDTQEAVEKLAAAQQVSVNAMKKSFEFQKKLAETSKFLFKLGCSNIATNRAAVKAIKDKLNDASSEELSEIARQEMLALVRQLKEQEDVLKKQEVLTSKVKENIKDTQENTKDIQELKSQLEYIKQNGMATNTSVSQKSRLVCLLLCLFLGAFGAHRFYCKKKVSGILYVGLALFIWLFWDTPPSSKLELFYGVVFFALIILVFMDLVRIVFGNFTDGKNLYVKKWLRCKSSF